MKSYKTTKNNIKILGCPICKRRTLMIQATAANHGLYGGIEGWREYSWFCNNCGKYYMFHSASHLEEVIVN